MIREKKYINLGLLFGSVRLFISKLTPEEDEFAINTITTTAGIRGTEFDVSVREDGAVLINVDQGLIETEFNDKIHTIYGESSSIFYLTEEREDLDKRIDPKEWQKKAIQRIRENPSFYLRKMIERERKIIEALKARQKNIEEYRKEWIAFLRRIQYLENRKMYDEEKRLIERQMARTKRGIMALMFARRHLAAIRSIIVLVARIEGQLDPETVKKLPSITRLREKYNRLSKIIRKIDEAERNLMKVLYVLNKKYDELNEKSN